MDPFEVKSNIRLGGGGGAGYGRGMAGNEMVFQFGEL